MIFNLNLNKIDDNVIVFEFPEFKFSETVSTFYYYLDDSIDNSSKESSKIIKVITCLLNNWLIGFTNKSYNTIYLPFGFEDEYISFLKISKSTDLNYSLQVICSRNLNGYSVIPSKLKCIYDCEIESFEILSEEYILDLDIFINDIFRILNNIIID